MKKTFFNIITSFFALVIIIPNIANLHSLDHLSDYDESVPCEFCEILTDQNQVDQIDGIAFYSEHELQIHLYNQVKLSSYDIPLEKIVSPVFIYNKPPPLS